MELLRTLDKVTKNYVLLAGGKGASLGEMISAGITVPPGYVVLSAAFDRFLDEVQLAAEIDSTLEKVDPKEMHTVEAASERVHTLILGAEMPEDLAEDIMKQFESLGAEFVAVRSSATAEDSAAAAWAGQLNTYLNTTKENLLENVLKCWASLFTSRAIFYRFEKGLHAEKVSVAVVIQKMVQSECAGVAFSVHPVTEDENQLIIEAAFGLGEAVVSGEITPDSYVVDKMNWEIIETYVSEQSKMLVRSGKGNEWKKPEDPGKQVLNEEQIIELSKLVVKIAEHYGFPCDIEWAWEGKFYITQSRPITTLKK
ncbi:MAG: PEP/pyruvate-binding domain-containing protein [Candidatus Nanoarchaeia archaeon]